MDNYYFHMDNLSVGYDKKALIHDICIGIKKGEIVTLIGPNGSGKSTLLRCLNLLETPTSGEIIFNNENILDKKVNKNLIRSKLCMVFQSFNLFNNWSLVNVTSEEYCV